jgi:hypothetical protein
MLMSLVQVCTSAAPVSFRANLQLSEYMSGMLLEPHLLDTCANVQGVFSIHLFDDDRTTLPLTTFVFRSILLG